MITLIAFIIGIIIGIYAYNQIQKKALKEFDKNKHKI